MKSLRYILSGNPNNLSDMIDFFKKNKNPLNISVTTTYTDSPQGVIRLVRLTANYSDIKDPEIEIKRIKYIGLTREEIEKKCQDSAFQLMHKAKVLGRKARHAGLEVCLCRTDYAPKEIFPDRTSR